MILRAAAVAAPVLTLALSRVPATAWGAVGLGALAAVALGGAPSAVLLLAAPLALLAPHFGQPMEAFAALFVAAAAVMAAVRPGRWRRAAAVLLALLALGGAARSTYAFSNATLASTPTKPIPRALAPLARKAADPALLTAKVDKIVQYAGQELAVHPLDGRPLVVILGSSSSGGGSLPGAWPALLAGMRPKWRVLNLAEGGATSWHFARAMARIAAELPAVERGVCVSYLGHNDLQPSLPGGSLLALVDRQASPDSRLHEPVPLEELSANLAMTRAHCATLVLAQEHARGREEIMAKYAAILKAFPGGTYFDAGAVLEGNASLRGDDLHPSTYGHQLMAEAWAGELDRIIGSK